MIPSESICSSRMLPRWEIWLMKRRTMNGIAPLVALSTNIVSTSATTCGNR